MCEHDDDDRLVERARNDGRFTNEGEQFLRCRTCGDTRVAYPNV